MLTRRGHQQQTQQLALAIRNSEEMSGGEFAGAEQQPPVVKRGRGRPRRSETQTVALPWRNQQQQAYENESAADDDRGGSPAVKEKRAYNKRATDTSSAVVKASPSANIRSPDHWLNYPNVIISAINEVTEKMNNKDLHDRTVLCLIDVMNNRCSLLAAYQKHFETDKKSPTTPRNYLRAARELLFTYLGEYPPDEQISCQLNTETTLAELKMICMTMKNRNPGSVYSVAASTVCYETSNNSPPDLVATTSLPSIFSAATEQQTHHQQRKQQSPQKRPFSTTSLATLTTTGKSQQRGNCAASGEGDSEDSNNSPPTTALFAASTAKIGSETVVASNGGGEMEDGSVVKRQRRFGTNASVKSVEQLSHQMGMSDEHSANNSSKKVQSVQQQQHHEQEEEEAAAAAIIAESNCNSVVGGNASFYRSNDTNSVPSTFSALDDAEDLLLNGVFRSISHESLPAIFPPTPSADQASSLEDIMEFIRDDESVFRLPSTPLAASASTPSPSTSSSAFRRPTSTAPMKNRRQSLVDLEQLLVTSIRSPSMFAEQRGLPQPHYSSNQQQTAICASKSINLFPGQPVHFRGTIRDLRNELRRVMDGHYHGQLDDMVDMLTESVVKEHLMAQMLRERKIPFELLLSAFDYCCQYIALQSMELVEEYPGELRSHYYHDR